MSQKEELIYRLSSIDVEKAVKEYLQDKMGNSKLRYNPEAFSEDNIYDSRKFWNNDIIKKPTLLDLEKYNKIAIEREIREEVTKCWKEIREDRNKKLAETDWTQYADVPLDTKVRTRYRSYRKYLRDTPNRYNNNSIAKFKIEEYDEWLLRVHPEDFSL
jgi:hypothetical protein